MNKSGEHAPATLGPVVNPDDVFPRLPMHGAFTLADQFVVSGTRFLLTVLVARACGAVVLGAYVLAMSLVYMAITIQQALICSPYANFRLRPQHVDKYQYYKCIFALSIVLAILASLTILLLGLSIRAIGFVESDAWHQLSTAMIASAIATPFLVVFEFFRRTSLVHFQGRNAFWRSCWASILILGCMTYLISQDKLNLVSIFVSVGLANLLAIAIPTRSAILNLKFDREYLRRIVRQHWQLGKWIFGSEMLMYGRVNFQKWIIGGFLGIGATGIYAACDSLMRLINPFFLGMAGIAEPALASGYVRKGTSEVKRLTLKIMMVMAIGALPICVTVAFSSEFLLSNLYGLEFAEYSVVVMWLAAASFVFSTGYPVANALQAIDRPDINFRIRIMTLTVSLIGVVITLPVWGLTGVAATHFACTVLALVARIYFFQLLIGSVQRPNLYPARSGR